jgi:hypothetical protein
MYSSLAYITYQERYFSHHSYGISFEKIDVITLTTGIFKALSNRHCVEQRALGFSPRIYLVERLKTHSSQTR